MKKYLTSLKRKINLKIDLFFEKLRYKNWKSSLFDFVSYFIIFVLFLITIPAIVLFFKQGNFYLLMSLPFTILASVVLFLYRSYSHKIRLCTIITLLYFTAFFSSLNDSYSNLSSMIIFFIPVLAYLVFPLKSTLVFYLINSGFVLFLQKHNWFVLQEFTLDYFRFTFVQIYQTVLFIFVNLLFSIAVKRFILSNQKLLLKIKKLLRKIVQLRKKIQLIESIKEDEKINSLSDSSSKDKQQSAAFFAFHDNLTMLPNREFFITHLEHKLVDPNPQGMALISIGINQFKKINNLHGHLVGDQILNSFANLLKKIFRENDLISRWGGDKFIVLVDGLSDYEVLSNIVKRFFEQLEKGFTLPNGNFYKITCRVGITTSPEHGSESEVLIKNCENSMNLARSQRNNHFRFYSDEMNFEMEMMLELERELLEAIELNQFVPYFQPKIDAFNHIIGMESLIRWKSPKKGLIPPFQFIPFAEQNGFISDIGKIILYQSCKQNRLWQMKGFSPLKVSVNLSPIEFKQKNLLTNIETIIEETQLDPKWLELEITESGIMENEKESIKKLNYIHRMGISISIDDFGTGYSSLSKLKDFPLDTLKIDKSFVDQLMIDRKSTKITSAIIDLSHNLGFKVVAEGVEHRNQLDYLKHLGCDYFQGYFFSKPIPAKQFEQKYCA